MTVRRADLGTPNLATCPRCKGGSAWRHPIVILTESSVEVEPWVLITCRDCGAIMKAKVDD